MPTKQLALWSRKQVALGEFLIWGLPPLAIPALRFTQDSREDRRQLFIRDFSTYSVGSLAYFLAKSLTARVLAKPLRHQVARRNLISMAAGVLANITYAGLGAVKLSQAMAPSTTVTQITKPTIGINQPLRWPPVQKPVYTPLPIQTPFRPGL